MWRPVSPRRLLVFSLHSSSSLTAACPYVVRSSHFSSALNYSSHAPSFLRRQDEESHNVRVSVWWDFENCHLPIGINVYKVAPMITAALRANGIKGPIQITAFGDVSQLSRANQEALSSTGINLNHIPNGGKNSADRSLLVDLMFWVPQNPPPAHFFLISGDGDFAVVLHRLRMNNYNILLASIDNAPDVLCSAASIMWHWNSLVRGEKLIGKHFNYPPDGSYGSWYGHLKAPIEDPFATSKEPTSLITEEVSESAPDSKVRPIPKSVLKQIQLLLKSHPKGISLDLLRSELVKVDGNLDKEYYGHRKFSRLLLSLGNILQIQTRVDGQPVVRSVSHKSPEPFEPSASTSILSGADNEAEESISPKGPKLGAETESTNTNYDAKVKSNFEKQTKELLKEPREPISHRESMTEASSYRRPSESQIIETRACDLSHKVQSLHSPNEERVEVAIVQETENPSLKTEKNMLTVENQIPKTEVGFFKSMWNKLFPKYRTLETKMDRSLGNFSSIGGQNAMDEKISIDDRPQKARPEDKQSNSTKDGADQECQITHSSIVGSPELKLKSSETTKSDKNSSSTHRGIYDWAVNWWQSRRKGKVLEDTNMQDKHEENLTRNQFEKPEIFADSSFWSDVEAFLGTIKGSGVVSQAKTREEMGQNLQKGGPFVLKSLGENDLLHLVHLLISERKWVEERPFQSPPFRITKPIENSPPENHSHESNGLSYLFLSQTTRPNMGKSLDHDGEKNYRSVSHPGTGILPTDTGRKHSSRSRAEVLSDCQKLVKEVLRENPGGFNMGSFRKLFLERYNYPLDIQKLGYQKLTSLMQIIPGVKVELNYIFPCSSVIVTAQPDTDNGNSGHATASTDNEVSESGKKVDNSESQWEELGPISNKSSSRSEEDSRSKGDAFRLWGISKEPDYEPALSEDDSADSDAETTSSTRSEGQRQLKSKNETFSLLEVLDSWHNQKEGDNSKTKSKDVDSTLCLSSAASRGPSPATSMGNYRQKLRPQKRYTFVSDTFTADKDKQMDVTLGCSRKSDESGLHNT